MGFKKKKILVTDDSHAFLMYISILLSKMGFNVIPAEDGLEALKLVKLMPPDLIMLDIRMSMLDGVKTLKRLKEDPVTSDIPVVIVSADSRKKTVEQCRLAGCSAYMVKPVDIGRLNEVLQDCLFAPMDRRRKHLRVQYDAEVEIKTHKGKTGRYFGVTLSEGGIFIRTNDPFAVGSKVEVTLALKEKPVAFKGFVIYTKGLFGDFYKTPPGMAIEFIGARGEKFGALSRYVREQVGKDILDYQEEQFFTID